MIPKWSKGERKGGSGLGMRDGIILSPNNTGAKNLTLTN